MTTEKPLCTANLKALCKENNYTPYPYSYSYFGDHGGCGPL